MEKDLDLSFLKEDIKEVVSSVVKESISEAYSEGAQQGVKEGTKKIKKELDKTKVQLDTLKTEIQEVSVEVDENVQQKIASAVEKASKAKPVKLNAKVKTNIEVDSSQSKKQAEGTIDEIQQILQNAMSKHKAKWRSFDLLGELKNIDLDTNAIEKKLKDLYKRTNYLINAKPQDEKQFVTLYAAHQALGGKKIEDYEANFKHLIDYKDVIEGKSSSRDNFYQSVVNTVQQLIPLLQAANDETKNLHKNVSESILPKKSENKSTTSTDDGNKVLKERIALLKEIASSYDKVVEI